MLCVQSSLDPFTRTNTEMSLPTRKLGGKQVNSIGFGAMGLSVGYGETGSIEDRLEVRQFNPLILSS